MAQSIINTSAFAEQLKYQLNAAMTEAAEPIIQETLKKIEAQMRKNLAANLISILQTEIEFESNTRRTVITIRQDQSSNK